MKRVLVISYYWPPSGGSGVQRWVKFAKYLPAEDWQPVIYTPENPELTSVDRNLENDIPPEAEVIKTRITEPYSIYRNITGKKDGKQEEVNPISDGKKSFMQKAALFIRGNFFIPDPRCLWIPVRKIPEKISERAPGRHNRKHGTASFDAHHSHENG